MNPESSASALHGDGCASPLLRGSRDSDPSLLAAAIEILDQGEALLGAIDDAVYTCRRAAAYNASIGGHYRHCLDHFHSLVLARDAEVVDYDRRRRDPVIETDRFAALNETRRLRAALLEVSTTELARDVAVVCKASYTAVGSQTARATFGRELMYAVAHAVHHYALIGILGNLQGARLPARFGVAPSTLEHQQTLACGAGAESEQGQPR